MDGFVIVVCIKRPSRSEMMAAFEREQAQQMRAIQRMSGKAYYNNNKYWGVDIVDAEARSQRLISMVPGIRRRVNAGALRAGMEDVVLLESAALVAAC